MHFGFAHTLLAEAGSITPFDRAHKSGVALRLGDEQSPIGLVEHTHIAQGVNDFMVKREYLVCGSVLCNPYAVGQIVTLRAAKRIYNAQYDLVGKAQLAQFCLKPGHIGRGFCRRVAILWQPE